MPNNIHPALVQDGNTREPNHHNSPLVVHIHWTKIKLFRIFHLHFIAPSSLIAHGLIMRPSHDPFQHLSQSIWKTTKLAHITFTVIGTLLLAPATIVMAVFWESLRSSHSPWNEKEGLLIMASAMIGTISGVFAWCALCLLYFKRCDLRWQRIAWSVCAIFGFLTLPCITGWIIWAANEQFPPVFFLILVGILIVAITSAVVGTRYSQLARSLMKRRTQNRFHALPNCT
jgi:hypothetical protein